MILKKLIVEAYYMGIEKEDMIEIIEDLYKEVKKK